MQFVVFSQEQEKENLKVYVDPKTGEVYWNSKLPVFVNLSTEPNGKGQSVGLGKEKRPKEEPYYFDTQGPNFIRSRWKTDQHGKTIKPKQEVLFPVIVDGIDPISWIVYNFKKKYVRKGVVYYDGSLSFSVRAKDEISGVERIMYSINKAPYQECKKSDTLKPNHGENNIKVYAVDKVGNVENSDKKGTNVNFYIDENPPNSNHVVVGPQIDNIYSPKCIIKLKAEDDLSGVKYIKYKPAPKKKGYGNYHKSGISLYNFKPGDNTIDYYATDHVDNKEENNSLQFFIDKVPPKTSFTIDKDEYIHKGKTRYVSARSTISLNAEDNKAGVDKILLGLNGGKLTEYVAPLLLNSLQKTNNTITYRAIDNVTNKSKLKYLNFLIDKVPPKLKWNSNDRYVIRRDTIFVKNTAKIRLTANDGGKIRSGIKEIRYRIDGGEEKPFKGEFNFSNLESNKLTVTAIDNVNNTEIRNFNFYVDSDSPTIFNHFSVRALYEKSVEESEMEKDDVLTEDAGVYPSGTYIYLGAKDGVSGNDKIYYSLNHGKLLPYTQPIAGLSKQKKYVLFIKAVDLLGNVATKRVYFSISNK
jgi:hypothetical protein